MSLQYRMIVEDESEALLAEATDSFTGWLKRRNDQLEPPPAGERLLARGLEISTDQARTSTSRCAATRCPRT